MNRRMICRLVRLLSALPVLCAGCAAIPLATLGTVADIAGSAATTGPAVYQMGKLDITFVADFATVQHAVRLSAYDLRLIVLDDPDSNAHPGPWSIRLQDNLNSKITITVDPRTPMLCRCRVDVGLFGSEPTAKVVMSRISAHLPAAPATQPANNPTTQASGPKVR
jgi:hypothetical protein